MMAFARTAAVAGKTLAGLGLMLGLALMPLNGVRAAPLKQQVDLSHVSIVWSVGHGGFTKVMGQFRQINSAELVFDREDVSKSSVKVDVEAASLDSNHYFRDNWARSEASLNVWKFPKILFESTKIEKTGDNTGTMTGNLTMHGVTKPVTMNVTYNKGGKHLSGKYSIDGFTATGMLKRTDFEMKAFIPWIGDEIEFVIQFEAHRPNDPT
jgi:polyisoprenoid-binding protein YceI